MKRGWDPCGKIPVQTCIKDTPRPPKKTHECYSSVFAFVFEQMFANQVVPIILVLLWNSFEYNPLQTWLACCTISKMLLLLTLVTFFKNYLEISFFSSDIDNCV